LRQNPSTWLLHRVGLRDGFQALLNTVMPVPVAVESVGRNRLGGRDPSHRGGTAHGTWDGPSLASSSLPALRGTYSDRSCLFVVKSSANTIWRGTTAQKATRSTDRGIALAACLLQAVGGWSSPVIHPLSERLEATIPKPSALVDRVSDGEKAMWRTSAGSTKPDLVCVEVGCGSSGWP
jgi:hypothetical protein